MKEKNESTPEVSIQERPIKKIVIRFNDVGNSRVFVDDSELVHLTEFHLHIVPGECPKFTVTCSV